MNYLTPLSSLSLCRFRIGFHNEPLEGLRAQLEQGKALAIIPDAESTISCGDTLNFGEDYNAWRDYSILEVRGESVVLDRPFAGSSGPSYTVRLVRDAANIIHVQEPVRPRRPREMELQYPDNFAPSASPALAATVLLWGAVSASQICCHGLTVRVEVWRMDPEASARRRHWWPCGMLRGVLVACGGSDQYRVRISHLNDEELDYLHRWKGPSNLLIDGEADEDLEAEAEAEDDAGEEERSGIPFSEAAEMASANLLGHSGIESLSICTGLPQDFGLRLRILMGLNPELSAQWARYQLRVFAVDVHDPAPCRVSKSNQNSRHGFISARDPDGSLYASHESWAAAAAAAAEPAVKIDQGGADVVPTPLVSPAQVPPPTGVAVSQQYY